MFRATVKAAIGLVVVIGLSVYGYFAQQAKEAENLARFGVDPAEAAMVDACRDSFEDNEVTLKESHAAYPELTKRKIDPHLSCACVVANLPARDSAAETTAYLALIEAIAAARSAKTVGARLQSDIESAFAASGVDMARIDLFSYHLVTAIETCSQYRAYRSPEEMRRIDERMAELRVQRGQ